MIPISNSKAMRRGKKGILKPVVAIRNTAAEILAILFLMPRALGIS